MAGDIRKNRVSTAIRKFLSTVLINDYGDSPALMVQINKVAVTSDLRFAKIHYYTSQTEEKRAIQKFLMKTEKTFDINWHLT